jgi:hypothetical protein
MNLRTEHFARCLQTLEKSLEQLKRAPVESIDYEIYRNAVVKGFELTLETAGKMLRKGIKSYAGDPRTVDELSFKEVLRHAANIGCWTPPLWSAGSLIATIATARPTITVAASPRKDWP